MWNINRCLSRYFLTYVWLKISTKKVTPLALRKVITLQIHFQPLKRHCEIFGLFLRHLAVLEVNKKVYSLFPQAKFKRSIRKHFWKLTKTIYLLLIGIHNSHENDKIFTYPEQTKKLFHFHTLAWKRTPFSTFLHEKIDYYFQIEWMK